MKLLPPVAPDNLGDAQAKLWVQLAPICSKVRVWSPALVLALNGYVRELDRLMVAEDWLTKNGSIIYIRDDKGILKSRIGCATAEGGPRCGKAGGTPGETAWALGCLALTLYFGVNYGGTRSADCRKT